MWMLGFLLVALIPSWSLSQSVPDCPERCLCFEREIGMVVRCMFLALTEIPKIPSEATILDLRFNKISRIPPDTFRGLGKLYTLLLNSNELTEIQKDAFKGLDKLKYLYLYKNKIGEVHPEAFSGLPNLEQLFLQNNKLRTLPRGLLDNLDSLKRLRLDENALVCDCSMMWLKEMTTHGSMEVAATCAFPKKAEGKFVSSVPFADFECRVPSFVESPQDSKVKVGDRIYLTCQAAGSPSPKITWYKNSNEIESNSVERTESRYSVLEDGTLMIEEARVVDQGVYECLANNAAGETKSERATVTVDLDTRLAEFTERPEAERVTPGQSATFRCLATGRPTPTIAWSRRDDDLATFIPVVTDRRRRVTVLPSGSLVILRVEESDGGQYRCTASTPTGSNIRAVASLIVNQRPAFVERPPRSLEVSQGEAIVLKCQGSGEPTPTIRWRRNDVDLVYVGRVQTEEIGTVLRIAPAVPADAGYYQCRLTNSLGIAHSSTRVSIRQLAPPTLVRLPSRATRVEASIDEDVELPCQATGAPSPSIRWLKDGVQLKINGAPGGRTAESARGSRRRGGDSQSSASKYRQSDDGSLFVRMTSADDAGSYVCEAYNDAGVARQSISLRLADGQSFIGDRFVSEAIREATKEVTGVINRTLHNLQDKSQPLTTGALLALVKFPSAEAQTIARSAEIYERTLDIVLKKVQEGYKFLVNKTEFTIHNILSPTQIRVISEVSGCQRPRVPINCTDVCFHKKYRTADGTCNNFRDPMWGASLSPFERWLPPAYENNFNTPIGWDPEKRYHGHRKPSARLVSTRILKAASTSSHSPTHSQYVMQWGQFLDHDLTLTPMSLSDSRFSDGRRCNETCTNDAPCFPIPTPPGDARLRTHACVGVTRSAAACGTGATSVFFDNVATREQLNDITSFIDASNVYGSELEFARRLRDLDTVGELKTGLRTPYGTRLLPFNVDSPVDCQRDPTKRSIPCFLAGDLRANEQLGLLATHTVFTREHNRIARRLHSLNPHWDGDTVYHEARKILGAVSQHVTFTQWLPRVLGERGMGMIGNYTGYNASVNPGVLNVFASAAFRFGHALINPQLYRFDSEMKEARLPSTEEATRGRDSRQRGSNSVLSVEDRSRSGSQSSGGSVPGGHLPLHEAFFAPWRLVEEGGVDPILRGLFGVGAKSVSDTDGGSAFNVELVERLFELAHSVALDLAALNVQRGRDHGLPEYNAWREVCGMRQARSFSDLQREIPSSRIRRRLQEVYGHPGNMDLFVGGMLERKLPGALVGPTFACILSQQLKRLRDGDRFYYENPSTFTSDQLLAIKRASLGRIICDNSDNMTHVPRDVFEMGQFPRDYVKCSSSQLPTIDLEYWAECCRGCSRSGDFTALLHSTRTRRQRRSVDLDEEPRKHDSDGSTLFTLPFHTGKAHSLTNSPKNSSMVNPASGRSFSDDDDDDNEDRSLPHDGFFITREVRQATMDERIEGLESTVEKMEKSMIRLMRRISHLEKELQHRLTS